MTTTTHTHPKRRITRYIIAAGIALAMVGGGTTYVVASSSAKQAKDPINAALGIEDASSKKVIVDAQQKRAERHYAVLAGCLSAAGITGLPASSDGFQQYVTSLTDADRTSLAAALGTDNAGCASKAKKSAFGDLLAAGDAFDAAETQMYEELASTPAVKKAAEAWRDCMGGTFDDPPAVTNYISANGIAGDEAAELQAQSLNCQQTVVDPIYKPLLKDKQAKFLDEHADLATALRAALTKG